MLRTIVLLALALSFPVAVRAQSSTSSRNSSGMLEGKVTGMGWLDGGQETEIDVKSNGLEYRFYVYPAKSSHLKEKKWRFKDSRPTKIVGFPQSITDARGGQPHGQVKIYYTELRRLGINDDKGQPIYAGKVLRIINLDNPARVRGRPRN